MLQVLARLHPTRIAVPLSPVEVRRVTFVEAARGESFDRPRALERASAQLGLPPHEVLRALFADRASERVVSAPRGVGPPEAIEAYNLALVEGLLKVSEEVTVDARGQVEAVLAFARGSGLLCTYRSDRLHVSGPLSILRHTAKYGHRLATFFPPLLTRDVALDLRCVMHGARMLVRVERPDRFPRMPRAAKRSPTATERALAADLEALGWSMIEEAGEWRLRREGREIALEILSFHTPEYVRTRLAAGPRILCVDETLACREGPLPTCVLRFRKRIDAPALIALAERQGQAMPTLDLVGVP
jgi:predicted nuclease of restriction endonuclease-like RecB superfamily